MEVCRVWCCEDRGQFAGLSPREEGGAGLQPPPSATTPTLRGNFKYYFADFVRKGGTPPRDRKNLWNSEYSGFRLFGRIEWVPPLKTKKLLKVMRRTGK